MKKKSLKKFTLRRYKLYKDSEGNNIEEYESKRYDDEAIIYPASSSAQFELYGMRIYAIMNMHYYGVLTINVHDMIIYEGVNYKVVSVQKYKRFKHIEIERL